MKHKSYFYILLFISILNFRGHAAEPVPDKTVVLTFDDAVKSHLTVVAPLLKEYGFGATFFICYKWMSDTEHFLTWEQVGELYKQGFEIANHSWTHRGFNTPASAALLAGELALIDYKLKEVGIPKPISFAWTGNAFGPEAREVLEQAGIKYARRGMQPEMPYGEIHIGPAYDPGKHHPLLIPTTGDAYPQWTLDHFKKVVAEAKDGKITVVQFHGVPDPVHPWVHTPAERFKEYMAYLKENDFNVISLKDVGAYVPAEGVPNDPVLKERYPAFLSVEVVQTRRNLDFWMRNMFVDHGYSSEEASLVCGLSTQEIETYKKEHNFTSKTVANRDKQGRIKVLPYPGGRHPRIGFLEGAISPQRGTKVSIFTPWKDGGYVVLDLPEAIFSNLGLTFLAHSHYPTIWDYKHKTLTNVDWIINENGSLYMERVLPNGIQFGATVQPEKENVSLEFWLENGSDSLLTDLRAQICLMLKAVPGFEEQTNDNKLFKHPVAAVKSKTGDKWILVAFENCRRCNGNAKVPCMHSDPTLPDVPAGERTTVKGRVWFYEGKDIEREIAKF